MAYKNDKKGNEVIFMRIKIVETDTRPANMYEPEMKEVNTYIGTLDSLTYRECTDTDGTNPANYLVIYLTDVTVSSICDDDLYSKEHHQDQKDFYILTSELGKYDITTMED